MEKGMSAVDLVTTIIVLGVIVAGIIVLLTAAF
ncbi:hypothetical protein HydSN_0629 [Hydrogenobaculum sp. SN]|jgi:hypothetical protein|nr:hypothetical protein Hyd3684_0615 [Hydrogenobaculum sp. 3684]AEG46301.1 hypothetical protein HydSHO_0615 [Hydrogenobaculum sp. SHO]AGG14946.1 hypothetical protein HydHO_0616 [Hydrogenobaculum sp. HO]AGH93242.1 hypothetical protein HydSN_0629 [Hydrogenobaculum sp. SN]